MKTNPALEISDLPSWILDITNKYDLAKEHKINLRDRRGNMILTSVELEILIPRNVVTAGRSDIVQGALKLLYHLTVTSPNGNYTPVLPMRKLRLRKTRLLIFYPSCVGSQISLATGHACLTTSTCWERKQFHLPLPQPPPPLTVE